MSAQPPKTPWEQSKERRAKRREATVAAVPGGRQQVNSGRTWFSPRDVRRNGFLVEVRSTAAKSYSILRDEFRMIQRQAIGTPPGQLPAMSITFEGDDPLSLFVIREEDHQYLVQRIATLEDRIAELQSRK